MNLSEDKYQALKGLAINFVELDKAMGSTIQYNDVGTYVQRAVRSSGLQVDDEDQRRLFVDLEYQFKISHTQGGIIFDDYDDPHDWYSKLQIKEQYYWQRYKQYLINHSSIDHNSIKLLDETTLPNIMNCLGNPNEKFDGKRLKRGLIIGDVQSGKTATYSGLICKAADAGYKVVILLAGITENLRQQTQERIDEGIVGYTVKKYGREERRGRVGVGLDNKALKATSFTTCAHDFTGDSDKIATSLTSHNSLVVFVIKKNVSVLAKLLNWLKEQNLDAVKKHIDVPMLLIDDEADNASVNTRKDETDPTKTNKLIRNICNLFKNATYVGFTATPFANVFIDPDSIDGMKQADLFPEHFIYALPTPSSYIGPDKIFFEDGPYHKNLRFITDVEEPDYASEEYADAVKYDIDSLNSGTFYYQHKKEWRGKLPESLREAVLCFFIANVVRDLKGQEVAPRSMLVNISRFVKVQRYVADHIKQIYDEFFNKVRFDFGEDTRQNAKLPVGKELYQLWNKHFADIQGISFNRIINKQNLLNAVEKIDVVVVNGSKLSGKLDYKINPSLRVIAVGGLALSRGLTLEGLTISYFYRNTATFDVLMQMGRWFGYRPDYDDIFQIWTSATSIAWYAEIAKASIELKEDIHTMYEQQLTPKDFGIKVRDNCEELRITAANKMRSSYEYDLRYSFYGNIYDTPYVSLNTSHNKTNLEQIQLLTNMLFSKGYAFKFADVAKREEKDVLHGSGASRYFENVPKDIVIAFLKTIKCSLVNINFNVENILSFVQSPETKGIESWDIVFEGGNSSRHYAINGLEMINCTQRAICSDTRRVIQISSRRRILGLREGKFALTKDQITTAEEKCRQVWIHEEHLDKASAEKRDVPVRAYFQYLPHRKPVLIIMLIEPKVDKAKSTDEKKNYALKYCEELGGDMIVAFAIGFPGVQTADDAKVYRVNKTFYKLYMQDESEDETEDEE